MARRALMTIAAALTGLLVFTGQGRSDEDCDKVVENIEDAVQVATKVLELELADVTKNKPEDEKQKATLRNRFCSASGEFLGTSRVYRAIADECLRGSKRRQTVASLDESIKSLQNSIKQTCE